MKSNRRLALIAIILTMAIMNIGCTPKQEPISKTAFLMDTTVTLKIYDKQDENNR